ncbi:hypothetical protein [Aureimonas sp. ME7]|uniref:hypothetical protein n=1 Tax=Aureimonas sp. ME7 TaxID=2744252 RepID=UPI0015F711B9|nr:hypothetical protein [Aureimonas sp. ME7]
MAFTPEEIAAGERLGLLNIGKFSPSNPLGLGQGGQRNFITGAHDLALFGKAVVRETEAMRSASAELAAQVQAAAILIAGGAVSSITVGGVTQTGAVTIDLAEVSEAAEQKLAEVQDALDQLSASNAAIRTNAAAYSLAFGG